MSDGKTEVGLQQSRNSSGNLSYYDELTRFFEADPVAPLTKLFSFAVYTPRQVLTDFLARYELFKRVLGVQGSIFEFGTFHGNGTFSFAHFSSILEPNNINRRIVTFDTFEGFPDVDAVDRSGNTEIVKEGGLRGSSHERLTRAVELFDRNRFIGHVPKISLVKGDILNTLDEYLAVNPHTVAALVYLDVDLYKPTKHIIERMLPRMPKGSILAFDELGVDSFPGETQAAIETVGLGNLRVQRDVFSSRISFAVVGD